MVVVRSLNGGLNEGLPSPNLKFIDLKRRQHEAKEHQRIELQGHGKPIVSFEDNGVRFVAVKNKLYRSDRWKTFIDFLLAYLRSTLSEEWLKAESEKIAVARHPIITWFEILKKFTSEQSTSLVGEVYSAEPNGAFKSLISLAYDLYLCEHNWQLPASLLKRLKNIQGFEGALYETYVIGCFAKAGFEIEFEDESKGERSYCEFVATHTATGRKFSVEAKAIKGMPKNGDSSKPKVHRKISKALKKDAAHDRIVFIELSQPDELDQYGQPGWAGSVLADVARAEEQGAADLPVGFLFFTNRPFVHDPHLTPALESLAPIGFKIPDFPYGRGGQILRDALASREREKEVYALLTAIKTHTNIPSSFDETHLEELGIPSDTVRLMVGGTYLVPNRSGQLIPGTLKSAIVNENEKLVYGVYELEGGDNIIYTTPISDAELRLYRRSPETFFGVLEQPNRQIHSPMDAYDFFWESYSNSTKEYLLTQLKEADDFECLKKLPVGELAKEYCVRMAEALWRDRLVNEQKSPK